MIIDDEVYLEHYGKKGMRWGQRKVSGGARSTGKFLKKHKKGVAISGTVLVAAGASFAAGKVSGGKGKVPISVMNQRSGQLVRDIGNQFVKDKIDRTVVLNYGRQIREGLINING